MIRRLAVLALVLAAAGCESAPPPPWAVNPPACRAAPDGGPPLADRGLGGSGTPARRAADRGIGGTGLPLADRGFGGTGGPSVARRGGGEERLVDRGIGGTGGPSLDRGMGGTGRPAAGEADRGIGGTGIVGIVSGFASVCVDGLEVALDQGAPVDVDGRAATLADLRVGQVVAIAADGPDGAWRAAAVSVRHEVSGPIEAVSRTEPGTILVAGQRVRLPASSIGQTWIRPGLWVAVSGLRNESGDIAATRIDARRPGKVLVHGPLMDVDGEASIGTLPIRRRTDPKSFGGDYVVAFGTYEDGALVASAMVPDRLASDPPAWFGPGTTRLVLAAHARFGTDGALLGGGYRVRLASGMRPPPNQSGPLILYLRAQSDGTFAVFDVRSARPVPGSAGLGATGSGQGAMSGGVSGRPGESGMLSAGGAMASDPPRQIAGTQAAAPEGEPASPQPVASFGRGTAGVAAPSSAAVSTLGAATGGPSISSADAGAGGTNTAGVEAPAAGRAGGAALAPSVVERYSSSGRPPIAAQAEALSSLVPDPPPVATPTVVATTVGGSSVGPGGNGLGEAAPATAGRTGVTATDRGGTASVAHGSGGGAQNLAGGWRSGVALGGWAANPGVGAMAKPAAGGLARSGAAAHVARPVAGRALRFRIR